MPGDTDSENPAVMPAKKPKPKALPPPVVVDDDLGEHIGRRCRALRELYGWSCNTLEDIAGVSRGAVWRLETGARSRDVSAKVVVKLAIALRVPVGWFVTGKKDDSRWRPPAGYLTKLRELYPLHWT